MVHVAQGSVIIYRPVADVWTQMTTAKNIPTYVPGAHSITTEAHLQQGTVVRGHAAFMGLESLWSAGIADDVVTIAYSRSLQAHLMNLADWLDSGKRRNLTSRHREVLRMIQQGLTDREIAEKLFISPKTVGHHVSAILAAFRVTHRQDLRRSSELPEQS